MSNLYKEPSKDASYHVLDHLAKRLLGRFFFRNQPIRNKNCLWRPCLLNRSELNQQSVQMIFPGCFLPCFDSFGKMVLKWKIFQKSTNQKQELSVTVVVVIGSGLNEHSVKRNFQGGFLPNFDSFGRAVIEEKMFKKSINQKQELLQLAMFVNGSELTEQYL